MATARPDPCRPERGPRSAASPPSRWLLAILLAASALPLATTGCGSNAGGDLADTNGADVTGDTVEPADANDVNVPDDTPAPDDAPVPNDASDANTQDDAYAPGDANDADTPDDAYVPDDAPAPSDAHDANVPDDAPAPSDANDANLPEAGSPDVDLPDADGPEADLPGADIPVADLPGEDLPVEVHLDADAAGADLPGEDLAGGGGTNLSKVTVTASSARNVVIRWSPVAGESVVIERAGPGPGDFVEVARRPGERGRFLDLGLAPESSYRYRLAACDDARCGDRFTSDPVLTPESGVPEPQLRLRDGADDDDVILYGMLSGLPAMASEMPTNARLVMVGRDGRVLWEHWRPDESVMWEVDRGPGNTLLTIAGLYLKVLDLDGTVVGEVPGVKMHHDVDLLSDGRALCVIYDPFTSPEGTAIASETIGIVNLSTGTVDWSWRLRDHLPLPDPAFILKEPTTLDLGHDWSHLNAVTLDEANGKLYANFLSFQQWFQIDVATGEIDWILGRDGDFGQDVYGGVHEPQILDATTILVMENKKPGPPVRSVAKKIQYDPVARTAQIVWTYVDEPPYVSPAGGSAIQLADGDVLITDAASGRIYEVTQAGTKKWEMIMGAGEFTYKAISLPRSLLEDW